MADGDSVPFLSGERRGMTGGVGLSVAGGKGGPTGAGRFPTARAMGRGGLAGLVWYQTLDELPCYNSDVERAAASSGVYRWQPPAKK